jgi:hypothetical protein
MPLAVPVRCTSGYVLGAFSLCVDSVEIDNTIRQSLLFCRPLFMLVAGNSNVPRTSHDLGGFSLCVDLVEKDNTI